jgi:phosphoenolpyruvate-protein phosphotransferase (PTS system enzyme I)
MSATISGIGVCPGVVIGPVCRMSDPIGEPSPGELADGGDRPAEAARIEPAMHAVRDELTARASRATGDAVDVLTATALMAADPALLSAARELVLVTGLSARRAVWQAATAVADALASAGEYLAQRADDVRDVRDRLVAELSGVSPPGVPSPGTPFVLVAHDLAPADTATLDPGQVLAIVTEAGGPTSHTAILARALGIPAIVAASGASGLDDGTQVLVDGGAGTVAPGPSAADRERVRQRAAAGRRRFSAPCATADGHRVLLLANVGSPAEAAAAAAAGAEGIGLFRTEFCFLGRSQEPDRDEQADIYSEVMRPFAGARVVVRTLDAGADKPMPFLRAADEPNPALGVRGARTAWERPHLMDGQLWAIAEAGRRTGAQVWVMAPMIATAAEAGDFARQCQEHGLAQAGVMVEVPAAALTAPAVLREAQFASIGTNDLLQYTMAADRMLGSLAHLNDPFQPALVRLIQAVCRAGQETSRPISVCGESASDPAMACVLAGLGVSSLSMSAASLADVAAALRGAPHAAHEAAAKIALEAAGAVQARAAVRSALPHLADLDL